VIRFKKIQIVSDLQLILLGIKRKVRIAFISRYLFNNWHLLLIKYILARIGFNVKLRAEIGNCTVVLDPEVFVGLLFLFSHRLIRSVECTDNMFFVNGMKVNDISDVIYNVEILAKILGWDYDSVCNCYVKDRVKFRHMQPSVINIIDGDAYSFLKVNGRIVVDVGAFIGDSAIYFVLKGAKRVISIEPHPEAYKELLENIRLNSLTNIIIPVNAGLASKPGSICIKGTDLMHTYSTYHRPGGNCDSHIPAITLRVLIDKYAVKDDAILKIDCEGCEYDVILNDYEHVRVFKELLIEYHTYAVNKSVKELLKILAKDYKCKLVEGEKDIGIIYCIRR